MVSPATQAQVVDVFSSMVSQLTACQRQQILQQCGLEMTSDSSAPVEQTADHDALLEADIRDADKFTVEQLTKKRKKNEKATHGQQTFAVSFNRKTVFLPIIIQRDLFKMFICVLLHCIEDKIYSLHLVKEVFSFLRKSYSNISQVEFAIVPLKGFVPIESLPGL